LAGESDIVSDFIIVGNQPSAPLNLTIVEVIPNSKITINWVQGLFNGGLPLRNYILNVNGVD